MLVGSQIKISIWDLTGVDLDLRCNEHGCRHVSLAVSVRASCVFCFASRWQQRAMGKGGKGKGGKGKGGKGKGGWTREVGDIKQHRNRIVAEFGC